MRLVIDLPPDCTVHVDEPVPLPPDAAAWRRAAVERDLPPGVAAEIVEERATETAAGWPLHVVIVVLDVPDAEERCYGFYTLLEHAAAAVVRGAERRRALALLAGARPDFAGGEVACLAELWAP